MPVPVPVDCGVGQPRALGAVATDQQPPLAVPSEAASREHNRSVPAGRLATPPTTAQHPAPPARPPAQAGAGLVLAEAQGHDPGAPPRGACRRLPADGKPDLTVTGLSEHEPDLPLEVQVPVALYDAPTLVLSKPNEPPARMGAYDLWAMPPPAGPVST